MTGVSASAKDALSSVYNDPAERLSHMLSEAHSNYDEWERRYLDGTVTQLQDSLIGALRTSKNQ